MIIELTIFVQRISCECFIESRFRSKILILNTYVYLLLAIMHNIVIPGYKDITLRIFFLVLFGNLRCFPVYGAFRYLYGPVVLFYMVTKQSNVKCGFTINARLSQNLNLIL